MGQSVAEVQYWKASAKAHPMAPKTKQTTPRRDGLSPMASGSPWTGYGVKMSSTR